MSYHSGLIVVVKSHILLCAPTPLDKVMTGIIRNTQIHFHLRSSLEYLQTAVAQTLSLWEAVSKAVRVCIYHSLIT